MSNFTSIYGYIEELLPLHEENWESYRDANDQSLHALPIDDTYPPLCRSMVAVTGPDSAHGSYRRRLIHLGGSFNDILPDLPAWLDKFDHLLTQLFWCQAELQIDGGSLLARFVIEYKVPGDIRSYFNIRETLNFKWSMKVYDRGYNPLRDERLPWLLGEERYSRVSNISDDSQPENA